MRSVIRPIEKEALSPRPEERRRHVAEANVE